MTGGDSQPDQQRQHNQQQLRLALAMRGGASMAVWIGGAVAEINHLRTAVTSTPRAEGGRHEPDRDHPWAALARIAGYDSVDVDVLAGTSAGGLNSVLMAASVVYGMRFDSMRRTWVRLADLEAMARPVPKFWQPKPPSLLEGDAYFRGELARAITQNLPRHPAEAGGRRMDLLLTATLLEPVVESYFDGRAEPVTQQRRRATFRFRHRGSPGQPLSDFGADADLPTTAGRLAQAARTTSSFPVAFEPAEVLSAPEPVGSDEPNMYGLFSESAPRPGSPEQRQRGDADPAFFPIIDGGVLDNIPVTAAIHSVADAMADRPTDRWLLYLNPEPDSPQDSHSAASGFALPVAATALQAKMGQETLLADIDALDEHNRAVERTRLRRLALFARLNSTPPDERHEVLAEQVEAVREEHARVRARLDAGYVHRLLTEPEETDNDPLIDPAGGDPLVSWSPEARTALREHLNGRFAARADEEPEEAFTGVHGLLSAVQECLAWAQDIESRAPSPELGEIGVNKARLYRLRTFVQLIRAHADRYWITGARLEPITRVSELDDWIERVARRNRRLQHALPSPVAPILGSVLAAVESDENVMGERFQQSLAELSAEMESIVDSSGADAVPEPTTGHVDAVAEARLVLHRIADRLARNSVVERDREPQNLGHTLLETASPEHRPEVLHRLVVLTAPIDVGRTPGSHIKFLRVVSDARTPLPFTALRRDGRVITPDKVRGSGLGNFAAFLSAKWRANDWMWGRLDSAASLVPLLVEPGRILTYGRSCGADGVADLIEQVVSRPSSAELGELDDEAAKRWREFLGQRWSECATDVRGELRALFDDPDAEHPLTETRRAVTERLHWTIAAEELPFVDAVATGVDPAASDVACESDPARLREDVESYAVGRQRWRDLDEQRLASVATRFALIAHRASLPTGRGALNLLTRAGATLLKPLLMVLALAVVAPTRTAVSALLATATVTFAGAGSDEGGLARWTTFADSGGTASGTATVVAALFAIAFAGWSAWQVACRVTRDAGAGRWLLSGALVVVPVAAGFWLWTTGLRLGPAGTVLAAVIVTWLATFGYSWAGRALASVLTGVVLVAMMAVSAVFAFSSAIWLLLGSVVVAYCHMVLLGAVDVLPPRPRPVR